jgi:prevent-host-death family protein
LADSPAQRIKEFDKKRAKLLDTAKKEALTRALQAVADLTSLGFSYRLVDDAAKPAKASTPSRRGTRTVRNTVVEAAERREATTISKHGRPAAVVVPGKEAYGRLAAAPRKSFASHLLSIPCDVKFTRIRGTVRDVDL